MTYATKCFNEKVSRKNFNSGLFIWYFNPECFNFSRYPAVQIVSLTRTLLKEIPCTEKTILYTFRIAITKKDVMVMAVKFYAIQARLFLPFTLDFNGLKTGKFSRSNTWLLILDPEVVKLFRHILISLYYDYISLLFNFLRNFRVKYQAWVKYWIWKPCPSSVHWKWV